VNKTQFHFEKAGGEKVIRIEEFWHMKVTEKEELK